MNIYLLNPPFVDNFVRSSRCTWLPIAGSSWYPIFLAYATGFLEKKGHECRLVDAPIEKLSKEDVITDIKRFSPELIVLYITLTSLESDLNLASLLKKKFNARIALVGPWCHVEPKKILKECKAVDIIVKQEFEIPLLEIADGKDLSKVKGLCFRQKSRIIDTGKGKFLSEKELTKLPFVTSVYKKHLNLRNYKQSSLLHPYIDLFSARGCQWALCTFCLWPYTIHKDIPYRKRPIKDVIEELKFIKKELPKVKEVFFQDDLLPEKRAQKISKNIIKEDIKIKWSAYSKADLKYETLKLMKKAGCRFLHIGYESSNLNILKNCKKGINPKIMERFTKDARKAGIKIHGDFIFGLEGETEETIKETIKWAKRLNISDYQFVIPQPHPGTPFYEFLKKNKFIDKDGEVSYPHLTREQLSEWRFKAYKIIYFNPKYFISHIIPNLYKPSELRRILYAGIKFVPNIINQKAKFQPKIKDGKKKTAC